jgi:diaminopimelate decarboxylase
VGDASAPGIISGAYGYAMSSRYNLREPAEEILI